MSHESDALRLRALLGGLFCGSAERFILTPSSLTALRLTFAFLGVRSLVLSDQEYYRAEHFPGLEVSTVPADAFPAAASGADAAILSVASWRGRDLRVPARFQQTRSSGGSRVLLIADYSHAGASGFPPLEELGADLAFGAPSRWLVPNAEKDQVGFVFANETDLFDRLLDVFRSFYLATATGALDLQSRWVDPATVSRLLNWLVNHQMTRIAIVGRHARNLALARELSLELGLAKAPETAIVWMQEVHIHPALEPYHATGLVWHPPGGGTRVMCREDVLHNGGYPPVPQRDDARVAASSGQR